MRAALSPSAGSLAAAILMLAGVCHEAGAQEPPARALDPIEVFSRAAETMAERVSPTVVQIFAIGYRVGGGDGQTSLEASQAQSLGSGVIVGADGYIMTNAHVVSGAHTIRVRLLPRAQGAIGPTLAQSFAPTVPATLVGSWTEADLALLKIEGKELPTLPFSGPGRLRQGQVVFAFGSPNGLQNSMTMGIVSSIARQLEPDDPWLYVQTDAPINPGSSGGPLVNTAGELVGLNTFISTQSGGSEGIGFAIPGVMVEWVYGQLRQFGHVHRPVIGAGLQTITPALASALKLPRTEGVLVSDVLPESPAARAGIKLNDILISVNKRPMDNVAAWAGVAFEHAPGSPMAVEVLRGDRTLSFSIVPIDQEQPSERLADLADLAKNQVPALGLLAVDFDTRVQALLGPVRLPSGVVIVGVAPSAPDGADQLKAGDIVHELNGRSVHSVESLRAALQGVGAGNPVALLMERAGQLFYVLVTMP